MDTSKEKIPHILQFFFHDKGENVSQADEHVNSVYGLDNVTTNHAQFWLRRFRSGIEEFGIPVLDPLYIPFVSIKASNNLELNFTDLVVKGLKDSHVLSHKILTEGNNSLMRLKLAIKLLEMEGHYKIDGNILILPVQGEGETKLVMEDVLVWVMINYTIVDGLFHSQDLSSRTLPQHATFRFDNLFDGDKQLGDQVNEFLNENAMSVLQDISPFLDQTINRIIDDLQRKLTSNIPMNEIFLNYV